MCKVPVAQSALPLSRSSAPLFFGDWRVIVGMDVATNGVPLQPGANTEIVPFFLIKLHFALNNDLVRDSCCRFEVRVTGFDEVENAKVFHAKGLPFWLLEVSLLRQCFFQWQILQNLAGGFSVTNISPPQP